MGPFWRAVVEYRLFSAVVTQDVIVEGVVVALGLISKKRNPHGAKLLKTDLFCGICAFPLGPLRENPRLVALEKIAVSKDFLRGLAEGVNGLAEAHNWDHSLCFICEDISSVSCRGMADC